MPVINIELSEKEIFMLKKVLENYLSDLSSEIADTDKMDYREKLKSGKVVVQRILLKLKQ